MGKSINQRLTGVPHAQIGSGMSLGLGFASAEAADGAEGDKLPHFQIQRSSGVEVSETVGGEVVLNVLQLRWALARIVLMVSAPKISCWTARPFSNRVSSETVACFARDR